MKKFNNIIKEEKNRRMITNIEWDADGDEEILESLPKEVYIPLTVDYDDVDAIANYLSDTYSFCVFGWKMGEK